MQLAEESVNLEKERERRVTGKEASSGSLQTGLVFAVSAVALLALIVLTFEEQAASMFPFLAAPPPPPPPPKGWW